MLKYSALGRKAFTGIKQHVQEIICDVPSVITLVHTVHYNCSHGATVSLNIFTQCFTRYFLTLTLCLCLAASLRAELNHLHATAIEHLKQIHLKENSAAKRELEKAIEQSHQQVSAVVFSFVLFCVCVYV